MEIIESFASFRHNRNANVNRRPISKHELSSLEDLED